MKQAFVHRPGANLLQTSEYCHKTVNKTGELADLYKKIKRKNKRRINHHPDIDLDWIFDLPFHRYAREIGAQRLARDWRAKNAQNQ